MIHRALDNTGTPYISYGLGQGADYYLEKAIGWAQTAGIRVWVDCHGSPGSQNGWASFFFSPQNLLQFDP